MTLAVLCSGQGHQHAGMFALTADAPRAETVFAAGARMLDGHDPRALVQAVDRSALQANRTAQLLCCVQALAAHAALGVALDGPVLYAGYSVGEIAAWGCAGLLDAKATLALVRERALIMDRLAGPDDGLAFVIGLPRATVRALCERLDMAVAIINPGDRWVVGGAGPQLDRFCDEVLLLGAGRAGRLPVRVASHTPRLAAATEPFRACLAAAGVAARSRPGARLLSGIDGETVFNTELAADKLAAQLSQPVDWAACLQACLEAGVTAMLELGPGRALADMAAGLATGLQARSLDEFRSLDGVRSWIGSALG